MKKNYLLLFLIALLFGTATMRGQSVPLKDLDGFKTYYIKVGNGYIHFPDATDIKCTTSQSEAAKCKLAPNQSEGLIESIVTSDDSHRIKYGNSGKIKQKGVSYFKFSYAAEGGKYYLKAAQGTNQGRYLTNKAGTLSFEDQKSNDAVVEITDINGASPTEAIINAKKRLEAFALFQKVRVGDNAFDSPIMGNGLGQYTHSDPPLVLEDKALGSSCWAYVTYRMYKAGHSDFGAGNIDSEMRRLNKAIESIKINPLETGKFVVISTKSPYEDAVRDNTKIFQTRVVIDNVAGPKQSAKYLKATATGYELTSTKSEASVFYFDGNHLTGLDNGFGLNNTQYKYDLTADAQKAVVAQGKLEKTLDAGSDSLKVGNKFVKLDNTSGLSVTDNESESHIFLEEATEFKLNTDALGYVSFFAPTAVEILDNVEVYTGKLNAQNSVVNLKKVNTKKIPANTAVLLRKGTSKTSFTVKKIASAPAITDNSLQGYTVSSNQRVANAYGFAVQGGKLVFIPLTDGVRAFKAVIFNGNAAGMQEFIPTSFAPTGIEGVTVEENKEEIFDLTGRRVESPVKGQVYVKGGKKFIQK